MLADNSVHDQSGREGVNYGKIYLARRGAVRADKQGRPIPFGPESWTRGDVILGPDLQPLRTPKKGGSSGRR